MARRSSSPPLSVLMNQALSFSSKAEHLAWKVTYHYLMDNMDENAKLEFQWYQVKNTSKKTREFIFRFFEKYSNPLRGRIVEWECRNVSACAIATMREVFEI